MEIKDITTIIDLFSHYAPGISMLITLVFVITFLYIKFRKISIESASAYVDSLHKSIEELREENNNLRNQYQELWNKMNILSHQYFDLQEKLMANQPREVWTEEQRQRFLKKIDTN